MPEVVVIGAGVVGAATTHALAQMGVDVELLEAGEICGGTSAATFAMDVSRLKTPRVLFDLSVQSAHEHASLQRACGSERWIHPAPTIEWAQSADDRARITEQVRRLRSWGYPTHWPSASEVADIEPALDRSALEGHDIALYREGAWYEPAIFVGTLLERAQQMGATVHAHDPVIGIDVANSRIAKLSTAAGRQISARAIVNCAGSQADQLATLAGTNLPLRHIPGLLAITTPTATGLRTIISADDLHIRPHSGARTLLHSWKLDAELGPQPPWPRSTMLAQHLIERGRRLLPALEDASLQKALVGVRPIPLDGLPIIGFHPGIDNFYAVVAHSAVHLAPTLGTLAANELTGTSNPQLNPFRPTRSWDSAVSDESTRTMLDMMTPG